MRGGPGPWGLPCASGSSAGPGASREHLSSRRTACQARMVPSLSLHGPHLPALPHGATCRLGPHPAQACPLPWATGTWLKHGLSPDGPPMSAPPRGHGSTLNSGQPGPRGCCPGPLAQDSCHWAACEAPRGAGETFVELSPLPTCTHEGRYPGPPISPSRRGCRMAPQGPPGRHSAPKSKWHNPDIFLQ